MHINSSIKYFVVGSLAACVSTLAFASGFSFSYSYSYKNNNKHTQHTSNYGNPAPPASVPGRTDNRPWGNMGEFKSGLKSQPLPKPAVNYGNYYLGGAPGTGWSDYQGWAGQTYAQGPYAGQYGQGAASGQPRVEVELSTESPYENQNVIYTARVVSSGNIKTLNPVLPRIQGAVLEKVDGPLTGFRSPQRNGIREIVNEYHFKLTPLRSGEIGIPAISFKGTLPVNGQREGTAFTATAPDDSLSLQVKPAEDSVTPWLPLKDLQIRANLRQDEVVKAGRPVTLVLELKAVGALGKQLPSLEQQLESEDYRIYHDSTDFEGGVSRDGRLVGQRVETYTLIPLNDGLIKLPELSIPWWDVDSKTPQLAVLPGKATPAVTGRSLPQPATAGGEGFLNSNFFWLPLILTMGLIVGFWLRDWLLRHPEKHRILQSTRSGAGKLLKPVGQQVARASRNTWQTVSPVANINRVRMAFALVMPKRVRLWMCARCLDELDSPDEWCHAFKQRVCGQLDIPAHTSLIAIGEKIIETTPQVEPARVRSLVHTLDGAIYGGRPVDFAAWKRDFGHQLRPRLARRQWRGSRRKKAALPGLNPRAA
ncbi:MAG: hypothetical protein PVF08_01450 [Gammaproteobacteria bacterium]